MSHIELPYSILVGGIFRLLARLTGTAPVTEQSSVSILALLYMGFVSDFLAVHDIPLKQVIRGKIAAMKFCIRYAMESWSIFFWMGLERIFFGAVLPLFAKLSGFNPEHFRSDKAKIVLFHNCIGARAGILTLVFQMLRWNVNSVVFLDDRMMQALSASLVRLGAIVDRPENGKNFELTAEALSRYSSGLDRSGSKVVLLNSGDPYNLVSAGRYLRNGFHLITIPESPGDYGSTYSLKYLSGEMKVPAAVGRLLGYAGSVLSILPVSRFLFPRFILRKEYAVDGSSDYRLLLQDCVDGYRDIIVRHPENFVPFSHSEMWETSRPPEGDNPEKTLIWKDSGCEFYLDSAGEIMILEYGTGRST